MGRLAADIRQIMAHNTAEVGNIRLAKDFPLKPVMPSAKGFPAEQWDPTHARLLSRVIVQLQPAFVRLFNLQNELTRGVRLWLVVMVPGHGALEPISAVFASGGAPSALC
jgi:hypothetical protein